MGVAAIFGLITLSPWVPISYIMCIKRKCSKHALSPSSISIRHAPHPGIKRCKGKILTHPYQHIQNPALTHFTIQRHKPFSQTDSPTMKNARIHAHTHNYISTLGVWQRKGKNQSGRPGTWMNRLWSKPHQRHIDDLPRTSNFLPSVGSGPLIAWGALWTSVTLVHRGSQIRSSLLRSADQGPSVVFWQESNSLVEGCKNADIEKNIHVQN